MHDVAEIGIGRETHRTCELNDIALVPTRRTRSSKGIDTSWRIDAYGFKLPMMMHPTDAIANPKSVVEFARLGDLAVLNTEDTWARHADAQDKIAELVELAKNIAAKRESEAINHKLQELHSASVDTDLLVECIKEVRATGAITVVRVSSQHARELIPLAIKADIDLSVIQGTLISVEHVTAQGEPLDLKDFIGSLDVPIIAGGVVDYQTTLHLVRSGAAGVIVDAGFMTSPDVPGISVPMTTATTDVAAARRDYLDEAENRYVHIITDGDIDTASDTAKAIICGTDAVALSNVLAAVDEALGQGYAWPSVAAHPKYPHGTVWPTVDDKKESISLEGTPFGPSASPFGDRNLVGGLRRTMAKCGFADLKSLHHVEPSVRSKGF